MRTRIGLAALALFAISSQALAAESRSDDFITAAIEGNLFEAKAGELAQAQGASEGVRKFGAMLAKDHAQAHDKSVKAAQSFGVRVPVGPSATQRDVLEGLAKLQGDRFDERFIASMYDDHLRDVARYQTQAKQGSDAISKYAADTLPTLRDHLKAVQGLRNERSTR